MGYPTSPEREISKRNRHRGPKGNALGNRQLTISSHHRNLDLWMNWLRIPETLVHKTLNFPGMIFLGSHLYLRMGAQTLELHSKKLPRRHTNLKAQPQVYKGRGKLEEKIKLTFCKINHWSGKVDN